MNKTSELLSDTLKKEAIHLLQQSCVKIEHCLNQLDEKQVWFRCNDSMNSIGNLLLHLAGNLQQWAVDGVEEREDLRQREKEFTADGGQEKAVLWETVVAVVKKATETIESRTAESWLKEVNIQGFEVSTTAAILHTTSHFVGHTHQIIFITRLLLGDAYQFQWSPDTDRKNVPI